MVAGSVGEDFSWLGPHMVIGVVLWCKCLAFGSHRFDSLVLFPARTAWPMSLEDRYDVHVYYTASFKLQGIGLYASVRNECDVFIETCPIRRMTL